jgi:hypothetical protein
MAERPRRYHEPRSGKGGGATLTAAASLSLAPAALMSQAPAMQKHDPPQPWGHLMAKAARALLCVAVGGAVLTWAYAAYAGAIHGGAVQVESS